MSERWERVLSLQGAHVDVNADSRTNLQLVIDDPALMDSLYREGYIDLRWRQSEWLVRGYHAELRQWSPTVTGRDLLPGVFYPQDFRRVIAEVGATVYELERRPGGLLFKLLYVRSGYAGYSMRSDNHHVTYVFEKERLIPAVCL